MAVRVIPTADVSDLLNRAYRDYNPGTEGEPLQDRVLSFCNIVKDRYGLQLYMIPSTNSRGQQGYELTKVEIIDEAKFTWFTLEWTQ